jgi:hypothetical protein
VPTGEVPDPGPDSQHVKQSVRHLTESLLHTLPLLSVEYFSLRLDLGVKASIFVQRRVHTLPLLSTMDFDLGFGVQR